MLFRLWPTIAVLTTILASWAECARGQSCQDSLTVDSITVAIPDKWCDRKLPDSLKADPQQLRRLPDSLCFEDYRIYVTGATHRAFTAMAEAARKDSIDLITDSGFRSASFQKRIIRKRLAAGEAIESLLGHVAPPGYSEHQTGRALDLVPSEARFAHLAVYGWLKLNAEEFGFVESFPQNRPDSLAWEPWHWLYVGTAVVDGNSEPHTEQ